MKNISSVLKEYMQTHNMAPRYQELLKNILQDPDVLSFLDKNKIDQNSVVFKRGIIKIFEFYDAKQESDSNYLPKLLLQNNQIQVEYYPSEELIKKQKSEQRNQLFHLLYLPENIKQANFESFEQAGRENAYLEAIQFTNQLIAQPTKFIKSPYFFGKFGVGKTYLLGAIANDLANNNIETLFVHVPTLVVELKNSIGNNSLADLINKIRTFPILILDDIGAENLSSWVRDDIFGTILQYRMDARLPTLFSSNFNLSELEDHLRETRDEYDLVKARRIIERIKFLSTETEIYGKNRRE
ncbi:primosomal protein DnaI [Xylocopilactobacillus apis]|uniref:Primosomal protein DnaI n=1 Tax=Xylocopilactobacillus apis TaxID=2932183 RepID=A0AAU9D290_9LACO|nr:primosomal protein DnaI [Xylocopilactobacillus apis]BDR56390.1 primosomal protein DnaI [Xylocopilactobacillus apis]